MFVELKKEKLCSKRENKSLPPFFDHLGVTSLLAYILEVEFPFYITARKFVSYLGKV